VTTLDGVRVVDNHAPAWGEGEAWRVAPEPSLTLGVDIGEPWEMLTRPRAVRLPDGRIVVADGRSNELHFFDTDGGHLATRGGEGEGPGAFRYLAAMIPAADGALLVQDAQLQRLTLYDRDAAFVDTWRMADHGEPFRPPAVIGALADGALLATGSDLENLDASLGLPVETIGWYHDGLFRYGPKGDGPRYLGSFERFEVTNREAQTVAFDARGVIAVGTEGFCHATGRAFEIRCYDRDGTLRQRIEWPGEPTPINEEDRERYIEKSRDNVGNYPQGERLIRETIWPEHVPVLHDLRIDEADDIWAERHIGLLHSTPLYYPGGDLFTPDASPWEVFAPDGTWLGHIDLPPGRTVQQIGDDWILLAGDDDDGVAHVWLYDLIKP
jgi:hypothetical protein